MITVEAQASLPPAPLRTKEVLALALEAGEIMLRSGAETSRAEETVNIMIRSFGFATSHCLVTPTGIYVSIDDPRLAAPVTLVHRVRSRTSHLHRISAVNDLSRRVSRGAVSLDEARAELDHIEHGPHPYPFVTWIAAGGAAAAGVALLLGGGPLDVVPAFAGTILVLLVAVGLQRRKIPAFFTDLLGGAVATALALGLVWLGLPIHANLVIAGGIMQLVPGAALLSSVQDGISGNLLSSGARGLETLIKAAALASGVGLGLNAALALGLHISVESVGGQDWQVPIQVVAAFGASACYAVSNNVPRFAIVTAGCAGAAGWLTFLLLTRAPDMTLLTTFLAALVVAVISWGLARGQHAPVTLYILPGMFPLLPGVTIYEGMRQLAQSQNVEGLLTLVHAVFLGGALAAGVALGDSLGAPLWRRRRSRRV